MAKKLIRCNTSVSLNNLAIKNMHTGKVANQDQYSDYYIVENVNHMVRDSVMNGLFYTAKVFDELSGELMRSNQRIPAPMSHPTDADGNFLDANDPITFNAHSVGAFDTDWRVVDDKLVSNTYIPTSLVNSPKESNKWFADSITNKKAIDRSTGLFLNIDDQVKGYGPDGEPYYGVVTQIFELNHSAILNPEIEPGAKNNGESVGMFTNKAGDETEIEDVNLFANASTPAMNLPLAPSSHQWNEQQAINNIKVYTNSNSKPSSNYRKFFLEFNQEDAGNFDAYSKPFADIIDGVPHAVKDSVNNSDSEYAKAYMNRFNADKSEGVFNKIKDKFKALFSANSLDNLKLEEAIALKLNKDLGEPAELFDVKSTSFVYSTVNGKLYLQDFVSSDDVLTFNGEAKEVKLNKTYTPINNKDSIMDRKDVIALMVANGITVNADSTDDELKATLNKALGGKPDEPVVDTATNAAIADLTAMVKTLQSTITANSDKELDVAAESVAAMNKGIDAVAAKAMGLAACNAFLAANGKLNVNAGGVPLLASNSDVTLIGSEMPVVGESK